MSYCFDVQYVYNCSGRKCVSFLKRINHKHLTCIFLNHGSLLSYSTIHTYPTLNICSIHFPAFKKALHICEHLTIQSVSISNQHSSCSSAFLFSLLPLVKMIRQIQSYTINLLQTHQPKYHQVPFAHKQWHFQALLILAFTDFNICLFTHLPPSLSLFNVGEEQSRNWMQIEVIQGQVSRI